MIVLIDEYQLSKDLREIVFQGMWAWKILLMQQSGLKTLIGKSHLRDAIDYLELDCISRLWSPHIIVLMISPCLMHPNTDSALSISIFLFVSHYSFEQIMMIFMLGYTVFLIGVR